MTTTLDDNGNSDRMDSRKEGLSEEENNAFNDGYLWATHDALEVLQSVLDDADLSDSEKIVAFQDVLHQASVPLMIASMVTGKDYFS